MNALFLFSDGSVNTQSKVGFGAYLFISDINTPLQELKKQVKLQRFEDTSSTRLELQTLLWALAEVNIGENKVIVYTDSQNILGLTGRRKRFEENNYHTKKNTLIGNHTLYKEFFRVTDELNVEFHKIKGHQPLANKTPLDKIFTLVDKASRNALRTID